MTVRRTTLLYGCILTMGLCWMYALVELMDRQLAQGRLSMAGLLLFYPVSFGLSLALARLRWPRLVLYIIVWVGWIVAMLVSIKFQLYPDVAWSGSAWLLGLPRAFGDIVTAFRPELLVLLVSVPLWGLGQRLAYLKLSFGTLLTEFQLGMALLVIALVVNAAIGVQPISSIVVAVLFFMFSLLGMGMAHAMEGSGWLSGVHKSQWSLLLLGSIGGVLVVGGLIAIIVTPDFLRLVFEGIKWVVNGVLGIIGWLLNLLPKPSPGELPPMTPTPNVEPEQSFELWSMSDAVRLWLQIAMGVIWAGLILFALWRVSMSIAAWLRRRLQGGSGAEFETVRGGFRADLLGLLRGVLLLLARVLRLFGFNRKGKEKAPEIGAIRRTYSQMLRWAASGGWPRQAWQTPQEYQRTLAGALPTSREDLAFITQEYVSVRYGPARPGEDDLRRIDESWRRIKRSRLKKPKAGQSGDRRPESDG